jgi:hypothetical protein
MSFPPEDAFREALLAGDGLALGTQIQEIAAEIRVAL